jgi:Glycosyltransferase family 92
MQFQSYKKYLILLLFNNIFALENTYEYNLAICAIFQNEARYLPEWLEFHKIMGVEHFFLYNNFSNDNYQEVLAPYIAENQVTMIDWPVKVKSDSVWVLSAYNDVLSRAKRTKWLAFLDLDEFLFPLQKPTLSDFLLDYENFGGVGANWVMFGTSNVKKIPQHGLITEYLTLRAPKNHWENRHIKSIIRPDRVISIPSQHFAHYIPGYFQVNANKQRFEGAFSPYIALDKIRINHYWSRDEDFFYNVKIARRMKDMGEKAKICIRRNEAINKERDRKIVKFAPQLKQKLSLHNKTK